MNHYAPYDKAAASIEDRVAWTLCQIIDDDAPMRWTRYRFAAICIVKNPELMADLNALAGSDAGGDRPSGQRISRTLVK